MNFHSNCKCTVIPMMDESSTLSRCDIMSGNNYVGTLKYCTILEEWILNLADLVGVTVEFVDKICFCLEETLGEVKTN